MRSVLKTLKATRFFNEEPIAVVNEGLLQYLDSQEKTVLGRNVHQLLKRFGGIWITPDISKRSRMLNGYQMKNFRITKND